MWKVVVGLALMLNACGGKKDTTAAHGVRLIYEIDPTASPFAQDSAGKSLELGLTVVRERISKLELNEPNVFMRDGRIVAELPPIPEAQLAQLREMFVQRDQLEFRMVAPMRPEVQEWVRVTQADPPSGISTERDDWSHYDSGKHSQDVYLMAPTREALERYVAAVAARTEPLARGFRVVYEQAPGRDGGAATWRTYVVDERSGFVPVFTEATVAFDSNTNQPYVSARLDAHGKQAFGELTAAHIGHKLAMVRGDRALSAPIIQSAIPGGAVWINMGGNDPREAQREADALVASLRATALPMPLVLARIEHF